MYGIVLIIHSWLRWAVLAAGLAAVARGGAQGSSTGRWFTILLDVQMLIGLLLYFVLSPFTTAALGDFGAAMKTPQLRFFAVEHVFGMVIGITLAHIGAAKIKKAPDATERQARPDFLRPCAGGDSRVHSVARHACGTSAIQVLIFLSLNSPWSLDDL